MRYNCEKCNSRLQKKGSKVSEKWAYWNATKKMMAGDDDYHFRSWDQLLQCDH